MIMKIKQLLAALCCLAILFCLCACNEEPTPTQDTTDITFPTLDESKTPLELLHNAADAAHALPGFSLDYIRIIGQERFALSGRVQQETDGSYTGEIISGTFTQTGTLEHPVTRRYQGNTCCEQGEQGEQLLEQPDPYTLEEILSQVVEFQGRRDLIQQFSTLPMTVSPSQDGSFQYRLEALTLETFALLLYGNANAPLPETIQEEDLLITLTTAPEGYLSRLEFTANQLQISLTIQALQPEQS